MGQFSVKISVLPGSHLSGNQQLAICEKARSSTGLVFSSSMSAIDTAILAYAKTGEIILHSRPLYGGTETLINWAGRWLSHLQNSLPA